MIKQFQVPHPLGGVEKISLSFENNNLKFSRTFNGKTKDIGYLEYSVLPDKIRIQIVDISPNCRSRNLLNLALREIINNESTPKTKKIMFCAVNNPFLKEIMDKNAKFVSNKTYEVDLDVIKSIFNKELRDMNSQLEYLIKKTGFESDNESIFSNPTNALNLFEKKFGKYIHSDTYEFALKSLIKLIESEKNSFKQ